MILYLDTETRSRCDLKTAGAYAYAYHPSTEVVLVSAAIDDRPPRIVDLVNVQPLVDKADTVVMHNAFFDRHVLAAKGIHIPLEKIHDTMVIAHTLGLPGGLQQLGVALRLDDDIAKIKEGKRLIRLFSLPQRNGTFTEPDDRPADWVKFIDYALRDVVVTREVYARLPRWNMESDELALWQLDQRINDRGLPVDLKLAKKAAELCDREASRLDLEMVRVTNGAVSSHSKRDQVLKWLETRGVYAPGYTKADITGMLKLPDLPDDARRVLEIRREAGRTSTAKYVRFGQMAHHGRIHGAFQYAGAQRTMRWAGRGIQPQNFPRPKVDGVLAADAILNGTADLVYEDVLEAAASTLRSVIRAEHGHKLVAGDYSNIEGRVLAWLAGEEWKLDAYRAGEDLYKLAYAKAFKVPVATVDGDQRFLGKVQELACFSASTRVLTNHGHKAIVEVTKADLLWDGVTWVKHHGVVSRGEKEVILLDGVEVTPDHQILVGRTWTKAQRIASSVNTLSRALARGSRNLPWSGMSTEKLGVSDSSCVSVPVVRPRTAYTFLTFSKARALAAMRALKRKLGIGERISMGTPTSSQTRTRGEGYATEYPPRSTGATTRTMLGTRTTEAEAYGFTKAGVKTEGFFWRISRLFQGRTPRLWRWIGSTLTGGMSRATSALFLRARTCATVAAYRLWKRGSGNLKPVYDIALAGPLHRYTIVTNSGFFIAHNCGYQGGVGAFASMAALYGKEIPEPRVREIVKAWRKANPGIVTFWYACEEAAKSALRDPGQAFTAGPVQFKVVSDWLLCRLPSRRFVPYYRAKLTDDGITYEGLDIGKWTTVQTFGGKLVENITQAVARDVMAWNMPRVEAEGFPIIGTVHDEIITEPPDRAAFTAEGLETAMAGIPPWAEGLPVAVKAFETYRYRKD